MNRIEEVDQRVDAHTDTDEFLWRLTKVQRALRGAIGRLRFAINMSDVLLESVRNKSRIGPEAEPGREDSDQQRGDDGFLVTTSQEGELPEPDPDPLSLYQSRIRASRVEALCRLQRLMRAALDEQFSKQRKDQVAQGRDAFLDEAEDGFRTADSPRRERGHESGNGKKSLERSDQRARLGECIERERDPVVIATDLGCAYVARARRTPESKQQSPVLPQKEYRLPPDFFRRTRREGNPSDSGLRIDAAEARVRKSEKVYTLTREPSWTDSERGKEKEFRLNDRSSGVGGDVVRERKEEISRRER